MAADHRYYAVACQIDMPNPVAGGDCRSVRRMLAMIDHAVLGYEPFPVGWSSERRRPDGETAAELHDRLALPIPNEFDLFIRLAREGDRHPDHF